MIIWCNMQSKPIHLSRSENNNIHVHILKHICIKIKVSHFKFNFFSVNGFKSEQCGTADFLKNCNIYHMSSKQLVIVCNYILHSSGFVLAICIHFEHMIAMRLLSVLLVYYLLFAIFSFCSYYLTELTVQNSQGDHCILIGLVGTETGPLTAMSHIYDQAPRMLQLSLPEIVGMIASERHIVRELMERRQSYDGLM